MTISEIIQTLLANRGISNSESFINPPTPDSISWADLNIAGMDIKITIEIIQKHIQKGNKIAIYGDYDVDGICSTAILWQTIYQNYKPVFPHIPDRRIEGYGLSIAGIDHCLSQGAALIITVDSGIVAHQQITYAKKQGLDVIVVDHHEKSDLLPPADALIHSTKTCAAGLSYFFARELLDTKHWTLNTDNLDLACLAVICDLVPLTGINRSFAKFGLQALNLTTRPGLLALYEVSGVKSISAYHVGFIIGPRLNATGRLTHAFDSLRLLCTNNSEKANNLAKILNDINLKRQQLTEDLTRHALTQVSNKNLIVVTDPSYDEGIIGLIAARLVEKFYRPAIAISVGEEICKASARSIPGFNITDCLRQFGKHFISIGGHSMAAGFSFLTKNIQAVISELGTVVVPSELLIKKERYDLELSLNFVTWDLWLEILKFQPFGLGNPTPVFLAKDVQISDLRTFGKTTQHFKFTASQAGFSIPAIWFNPPQTIPSLVSELYYQIDADTYRGPGNIQLIVKSI